MARQSAAAPRSSPWCCTHRKLAPLAAGIATQKTSQVVEHSRYGVPPKSGPSGRNVFMGMCGAIDILRQTGSTFELSRGLPGRASGLQSCQVFKFSSMGCPLLKQQSLPHWWHPLVAFSNLKGADLVAHAFTQVSIDLLTAACMLLRHLSNEQHHWQVWLPNDRLGSSRLQSL